MTQTYWQQTRISRYWKGQLVRDFVLGVPAYRLRYVIPSTLPTIERFYRTMRTAIYAASLTHLASFDGRIELDETMFGGRVPGKRGWGAQGKHIVFGIYKRNGKVMTFPVSSRRFAILAPIIARHTAAGSLYYSDDWHAYSWLSVRGNHVVIEKEKGQPKGRDHINGIEGFWSFAKHWLYQFRGVPKTYFHLYLKEVEWRFNHRDENLLPILRGLLNQSVNVQPV